MQGKGRENDEELALFFDMRRREKENEVTNNLSSDQFDGSESANPEYSPISKCLSSLPLQRRSRDEFLNSENEKSDYDWLLTPPGTPLVSVETELQRIETNHIEIPARPIALRSRPSNIQVESVFKRTIASKPPNLTSELNTSTMGIIRRPSSAEGPKPATRRSATPTGRPTLPSSTKPIRSSMPNSQPSIVSSIKSVAAAAPPVRSSTPSRSSFRSSTPTGRPSIPAAKSTARSATPTSQPRASSTSKTRPTSSKISVPSRGPSPTVKSRPWKPSEMPGFADDAPPNLKTSLPERSASASRGRPVAPNVGKPSSTTGGSNGRLRQQSCSPSRARALHCATVATTGNSFRSMTRSSRCGDGDEVSPVVMGTKMVERVVNMRKLVPPKREDDHSGHNNSGGKSLSSVDSLGFGRTLSKKSLDMALRHMDIRRSMHGNSLRPLATSVPASSVYSVRSGATKNKTPYSSDSPHATSSTASSEPSVNNAAVCFDGNVVESYDV